LFDRIDTKKLTANNMETYNKSITEYADVRFIMASNLKRGIEEGFEKGIEKGMEKGVKKVALNMLNLSIPIKDIAKATGLTPEQIRSL
jgi:predicted transposase/invertase (TIGR01784 family)